MEVAVLELYRSSVLRGPCQRIPYAVVRITARQAVRESLGDQTICFIELERGGVIVGVNHARKIADAIVLISLRVPKSVRNADLEIVLVVAVGRGAAVSVSCRTDIADS